MKHSVKNSELEAESSKMMIDHKEIHSDLKNNKKINEIKTALYCRLSVDDGTDGESNSISNQKDMLLSYAAAHGWYNCEFFVDDGFSGTTFDRPDFKRMQQMVADGQIGRIIVKDLSRFGRNYIEAGKYLEMLYPMLGVQFIALQEHVDTSAGEGLELIPFSNIFNEWYAAQTSKKVRAVWQLKSTRGEHVCPRPPYGYVRDPADKNRWLVDEYAAAIVRRIYAERLAGRGSGTIAHALRNDGILVPSAWREANGRAPGRAYLHGKTSWSAETVYDILRSQVYTGCAVNGKSTTVSYKVKKRVYLPEEKWTVIQNAHPAIVDRDTFDAVQQLYEQHIRAAPGPGRGSTVRGLLWCADCGAPLYLSACRTGDPQQDYFKCGNYRTNGTGCSQHYVRRHIVEQWVSEAVQRLASFSVQHPRRFARMLREATAADGLSCSQERQRAALEKRRTELDTALHRLYEEHLQGTVSELSFRTLQADYTRETEQNERQLNDLLAQCLPQTAVRADQAAFTQTLHAVAESGAVSEAQLRAVVARVTVHETPRYTHKTPECLTVYFRCIGEVSLD